MSRLCLDTSAYSHFQRGDDEAVELLDRAEWIGVPAVVLGELRTGFLLGSRQRRNEADLQEFLDNSVVHRLPVDEDVSRHYAAMMVGLRKAGTPLPINDVWIAATAARHGSLVLTHDRHFSKIESVGAMVLQD